ncbi:hypothetical protein [Paraburkholderia kirstenboschensis]|uniref:RsbT co-antagonist protein RsbRD N-terminal domain-containing protein n=1 Tax=Paraburkholderia kirstenboschensis TaxID=1245436 RepID=A0ABZ0ECS2_9BURK|nr:hypothetical protein [Paraburkholderia kirstenboschensis]WOD14003.1 hypothetical protein RW095_00195 [Paraburkholderia kirstenboschensis]
MGLADFIEAELRGLIDDWTDYARVLSQDGSQLRESQLRNSAADILMAVAANMRKAQSPAQQETRSRGDKDAPHSTFNHVAHEQRMIACPTASASTMWLRNSVRCAPQCCAAGRKRHPAAPQRSRR